MQVSWFLFSPTLSVFGFFRLDQGMAPEGGPAPPTDQNSMGPSGNEATFPSNRFPQQRWAELQVLKVLVLSWTGFRFS